MKKIIKRSLIALAVAAAVLIGCLALPPAFHREAQAALPEDHAGGRIACIDDNTEALVWRLRLIESAEEELILSTFGLSDGESGRDLMAALLNASRRGVEIRLLLDGFNGSKTLRDSEALRALAAQPNVEVRVYNEINLLTPWKANYRMHDKYVIADDSMYLLGGRNSNDLFLGEYSSHPNLDRDILVRGSGSLADLRAYFESVWALPECKAYDFEENEDVCRTLEARYEALKVQYPTAFGFTDWDSQTIPANSVALLTNPIAAENKEPVLWKNLCALMADGSDIWIQTPYIICGDEMYDDLEALCGSRSVTVLTNSTATGANPFGCADLQSQRDEIASAGAELVEYAGQASMHTKTLVIDDDISIVGSFNMDMRSAYIDTETMLVIDCPELNAHLRSQMEALAAAPAEESSQPFWYPLLRLIAPLIRHLL